MITRAQDVCLQLIGASGEWNAFNGPRIEADLRGSPGLWRSVLLTKEVYGSPGLLAKRRLRDVVDLISLRDLPQDLLHFDTLFIWVEPTKQDELEAVAKTWEADEVSWVQADEAFPAMGTSSNRYPEYSGDSARVVLRAWWD